MASGEGGFEILVGSGHAIFEADDRLPAGGFDFADIEEFARGAVGLGRIGEDLALETDGFGHQLGELENGQVGSGAAVHPIGRVVEAEEVEAG